MKAIITNKDNSIQEINNVIRVYFGRDGLLVIYTDIKHFIVWGDGEQSAEIVSD